MNPDKFRLLIPQILLTTLLFALFSNGYSFIKFKRVKAKYKKIIVLLDETDSFGRNSHKGVAEKLYWKDALTFTKMIVNRINPGDEFVVLAIDEKGFQEEDILISFQQLEKTFLKSKVQKRKLVRQIAQLKRRKKKFRRTDILGALFQAAYFAKGDQDKETVIFCFSDMKQEPKPPTPAQARDLKFPANTTGYFFFVDASGKESWDQIVHTWEPIFSTSGLNVKTAASLNFFQYGESELHMARILQSW